MVKVGDTVTRILVTKDDNINDQSIEGYEISIALSSKIVTYIEYYIEELEDSPRGIYEYINNEYIQIENWDE